MRDAQLGAAVRTLRRRRLWRQEDLARVSGVSRALVSTIESGQVTEVRISRLRSIARALEASLVVEMRWGGGALDRLLDERHAALASAALRVLESAGWTGRPEISYSRYGERGSIDLLAWHAATRSLLVVEIKTELASVEATLRKLDEKARLASVIAAEQLGWRADAVGRALILSDTTTNRRHVRQQGRVLKSALPASSATMRAWLRAPAGPIAGIMFLPNDAVAGVTRGPATSARIRRRM
jgi:transcriptional regulator with XRE-family HTH domain